MIKANKCTESFFFFLTSKRFFFFTLAFFMLTVFCSMITHQQNHREQHNSFCSEEGQGESVALFFLLKH